MASRFVVLGVMALVGVLALGTPANAQQVAGACVREDGSRKPIPGVPDALRGTITSASAERLEITSLSGTTIRFPICDIEPGDFRLLLEGRFLGFSYSGHEVGGYLILDRARGDAPITYRGDNEPLFSPDRERFAVLSSPSEMDNVLGILTIYDLLPRDAVVRFSTNMLPLASGWRIERWQGNQCLVISAIEPDWRPNDGQDWEQAARTAPRRHYSVLLAPQVLFHRSNPAGVCGSEPLVQEE